jgi:hypothetical protein|tara:strand:+ start:1823 stop:2014 length:192 start_codon:yes stop_codon:yes gene_type:complete
MSKLVEQTIVKTVEEMIVVDGDMNWIREEVEYMFDTQFNENEWETITTQALLRRAFTRPLPEA